MTETTALDYIKARLDEVVSEIKGLRQELHGKVDALDARIRILEQEQARLAVKVAAIAAAAGAAGSGVLKAIATMAG